MSLNSYCLNFFFTPESDDRTGLPLPSNRKVSHTYLDGDANEEGAGQHGNAPTVHTIRVDLIDDNGLHTVDVDTKDVTVDNLPPTLTVATSDSRIDEGDVLTLTLADIDDVAGDVVETNGFKINWGDDMQLERLLKAKEKDYGLIQRLRPGTVLVRVRATGR